jgi:hypothetical protein
VFGSGLGGSWKEDIRLGVRRALVEAYVDHMFWWEASMMVQRLVRAQRRLCALASSLAVVDVCEDSSCANDSLEVFQSAVSLGTVL